MKTRKIVVKIAIRVLQLYIKISFILDYSIRILTRTIMATKSLEAEIKLGKLKPKLKLKTRQTS